MFRRFFSLSLLLIAACETVPATLDPAIFSAEMTRLEAETRIATLETEVATFLARTDLTPVQRADGHYLRAEKRLDTRFNLPGAIEDYRAVLGLNPEDLRSATVERRILFANSEIEAAQRRLARLQNLPDWFDDKVLMGELQAAATRYRSAGLTPTEQHFRLMQDGGFICAALPNESVANPAIHRYGDAPDYAAGASWCVDPSLS